MANSGTPSNLSFYRLSSMEEEILKGISEGRTDFSLEPLMVILNDLFHYSSYEMVLKADDIIKSHMHLSGYTNDLPNNIVDIIGHLTLLISSNYACGIEVHDIVFNIFHFFENYTWKTQLVLILATFIMIFAEFSLVVVQRMYDYPLAHAKGALSSSFMSLSSLVNNVFEVCQTALPVSDGGILQRVTYQVSKILVACFSYMDVSYQELLKINAGYITLETEIRKLEQLSNELLETQTYLTDTSYKKVGEYFQTQHQDVAEVLVKVFTKQNALNGGQMDFNKLKGKSVAFLISDLKISEKEFTSVSENPTGMEIVWIPMVDPSVKWTNADEQAARKVASSKSWHWCEPSILTKEFSIYVRQELNLQSKSTLVILDKQGKLLSTLPMAQKSGASAFPEHLIKKPTPPKTLELSATDLIITWDGTNNYWHWHSMGFGSSTVIVVELFDICWLQLGGKFNMTNVTQNTMYEIFLVVKMRSHSYGWEVPVNLKMTLPSGHIVNHTESLLYKPRESWFEIKMGEFYAHGVGDVEFSLYEVKGGAWKRGLVVKGAFVRPKS